MRVLETVPNNRWGYLNLGAEAAIWHVKKQTFRNPVNPLLKPSQTQKVINVCHRGYNIDASYGGWLENRHPLWRGSYLDKGEKYIHLGVDFNVPAGTPVFATQPCCVVRIGDDHPLKGGWGPHVVVRLDSGEGYLVYGHLLKGEIMCLVGQELEPETYFAHVGEPKHNGKWFSHLHVQFMTREAGEYYLPADEALREKRWNELDGYCNENDLKRAIKEFRDPLPFVA